MKTKPFFGKFRMAAVGTLAILMFVSCKKLPEPSFTYEPTNNPEAGEIIQFQNTTVNATSYIWDFGDGGTSSQEHPAYVFEQAGIYGVRLTASNEDGDESVIQSVAINEPTVLAFLVTDNTGEYIIPGADVWVYDNKSDWDNIIYPPQFEGVTDNDGYVIFINMEPITYYLFAIKIVTGGIWFFEGYTNALNQNEINLYTVPCDWVPDAKKNASSVRALIEQIRSGTDGKELIRKE